MKALTAGAVLAFLWALILTPLVRRLAALTRDHAHGAVAA